jgi:uncharacterized protein
MENRREDTIVRRRKFLKELFFTTIGMSSVGAEAYYYVRDIEPSWLDITHISLRLSRLTQAFYGYRLVHISDLHTDDTWMTADRLRTVVQTINNLHPDLLVITGDYVTDYLHSSKRTLAELRNLRAKDGIFGTLGNHDHWAGAEIITEIIYANHIQVLNNAIHTIRRNEQMLHIVGMGDLLVQSKSVVTAAWSCLPVLNGLTASLPEEGAAVLLVHEPDFADVTASVGRYDLQLSGHSHGGQVRVPFYGPLELPPLAQKYPGGLYRVGDLVHYTSRGLGMVKPQVRFNCRPEITVFELYP